jgi:transcriptional regulator with XRE-family HTH domain
MVTEIYGHRKRLFLREHREDKKVSAPDMAGRLGIERESVYRIERKRKGVSSARLAQWAEALDMAVEDLWRPPGRPSLDAMVEGTPEEIQDMAVDIVRRLVAGKHL